MKLKKGKSYLGKSAENIKRKIKQKGWINKQRKVETISSPNQEKKKRSLFNDDEEMTKKFKKKQKIIKDKSQKKKASFNVKSPNLEEESAKIIGKKKKRPWRQAVRNRAKCERLRLLEQDENDSEEEEELSKNTNIINKRKCLKDEPEKKTNSTTKMIAIKKKKMSRVKRLKNKQRLLAQMGGNNEADEDEVKENLLKKNAKSRMDASRFRFINEQLYTQPSTSAVQMFATDPDAFKTYHRGYKEQLKKWPVNPIQTIIFDLSTMEKGSVVADLGCGEAKLAQKLGDQFRVYSFDLVATNEQTVVADMANLPLAASSVDVCVYCLSLMSTNLAHFFREAHRILKKGGKLKIAEVASRFQNVKTFIAALNKMGFQLKHKKEIGEGFFIILTLQKVGKIENKRPLGLHLLPCLYKKR